MGTLAQNFAPQGGQVANCQEPENRQGVGKGDG